ncbi:MAG: 23S rRNA (guanosine(2251)-2'-O)-methyltransferase RlmB [Deltaproteobacteria bacterium]|nr:23S rRNA (guanosine(2251)-2'-O)-methyltransferase RlmB [Deltaproteobacteria bacterium]
MAHPSPPRKPTPLFLPGFHAVHEALVSGRIRIMEIWLREVRAGNRMEDLRGLAEKKRIPVLYKRGDDMDELLPGLAHQGVVALTGGFLYSDLEEIMDKALRGPGGALVLAADHITDVGNLGALVRTGAFFGAHGLILPKDRSAAMSAGVMKRSSGAFVHLPVSRVVNLGRALDRMAERGFWVIGTAGESQETLYRFDWRRHLVLVLGSEEKGLSPNIRRKCQHMVSIPGCGKVESLNVAVAAGVILTEIARQRKGGG